jgi:hypothetical protein
MTERQSDRFANDVPYDIKLHNGLNHFVIVDTRSYSGNFEREMGAFMVGAFNPDGYHGGPEYEKFEEAKAADPRLETLEEKVRLMHHDEYAEVATTIWPTPGRLNNGRGGHSDDDGTQGYPAYESVAVGLEEPLTEEELQLVLERAKQYGACPSSHMGKSEPIAVVGIRQLTFEHIVQKRTTRV